MILYIHSNSFSRKPKIDTKCYHLLAITLSPTWQTWNFLHILISNNKSFISKVVGPLGEKFDFSVPQDLKFKALLITEPQKSSSTLSELWNAIWIRKIWYTVTATISKFCPQMFETYFNLSLSHLKDWHQIEFDFRKKYSCWWRDPNSQPLGYKPSALAMS